MVVFKLLKLKKAISLISADRLLCRYFFITLKHLPHITTHHIPPIDKTSINANNLYNT